MKPDIIKENRSFQAFIDSLLRFTESLPSHVHGLHFLFLSEDDGAGLNDPLTILSHLKEAVADSKAYDEIGLNFMGLFGEDVDIGKSLKKFSLGADKPNVDLQMLF